jgi:1-acyl-sn-glycerol-3-phosphate acyltransferase
LSADEDRSARPGALVTLLATLSGNLYLVFGTLFFSVLSILASLVPPRGRWVYYTARLWARGALLASGIRLRVESELPLDRRSRFVFVANHQSLFDIPALLAASPGQVRLLAKASLFRIPVFGWALAAGGFVPVDRGARKSSRDSFAKAIERLDRDDVSVLLFPEEKRSLDGRLLPFRRGGFLLALKTGRPIVPVGVDGSFTVQSRRSFLIRPRPITVRYGAPLDLGAESVRQLPERIESVRGEIARLARTGLAGGDSVLRG